MARSRNSDPLIVLVSPPRATLAFAIMRASSGNDRAGVVRVGVGAFGVVAFGAARFSLAKSAAASRRDVIAERRTAGSDDLERAMRAASLIAFDWRQRSPNWAFCAGLRCCTRASRRMPAVMSSRPFPDDLGRDRFVVLNT
jgi:hypothetical protein